MTISAVIVVIAIIVVIAVVIIVTVVALIAPVVAPVMPLLGVAVAVLISVAENRPKNAAAIALIVTILRVSCYASDNQKSRAESGNRRRAFDSGRNFHFYFSYLLLPKRERQTLIKVADQRGRELRVRFNRVSKFAAHLQASPACRSYRPLFVRAEFSPQGQNFFSSDASKLFASRPNDRGGDALTIDAAANSDESSCASGCGAARKL